MYIKERWILDACLSLFFVGLYEFFYLWFFRFSIVDYSRFALDYSFKTFSVQFIQVYSVLFIPLMVFLGFKYRNSVKFNSKKIKILVNLLLILFFSLLVYGFKLDLVNQWIVLFMVVFVLVSANFNSIFAFSFSYLSFYSANMLFEFWGLHFLKSFGTLLSYILVFGIFILVVSKLKIKIDEFIILSFIPILLLWMNYSDILNIYVRLFTFPFFMIVTLKIYFQNKKQGKS